MFVVGRFDAVNTLIDVDDGVLKKRAEKSSPSCQIKDDFVDTVRTYVTPGFVPYIILGNLVILCV